MTPERLAAIRHDAEVFPGLPWGEGMVEDLLGHIAEMEGNDTPDVELKEIAAYVEKLKNSGRRLGLNDSLAVKYFQQLLSTGAFLKCLIHDLKEESSAYRRGVEDGRQACADEALNLEEGKPGLRLRRD